MGSEIKVRGHHLKEVWAALRSDAARQPYIVPILEHKGQIQVVSSLDIICQQLAESANCFKPECCGRQYSVSDHYGVLVFGMKVGKTYSSEKFFGILSSIEPTAVLKRNILYGLPYLVLSAHAWVADRKEGIFR